MYSLKIRFIVKENLHLLDIICRRLKLDLVLQRAKAGNFQIVQQIDSLNYSVLFSPELCFKIIMFLWLFAFLPLSFAWKYICRDAWSCKIAKIYCSVSFDPGRHMINLSSVSFAGTDKPVLSKGFDFCIPSSRLDRKNVRTEFELFAS